jgi:hypothetical protein
MDRGRRLQMTSRMSTQTTRRLSGAVPIRLRRRPRARHDKFVDSIVRQTFRFRFFKVFPAAEPSSPSLTHEVIGGTEHGSVPVSSHPVRARSGCRCRRLVSRAVFGRSSGADGRYTRWLEGAAARPVSAGKAVAEWSRLSHPASDVFPIRGVTWTCFSALEAEQPRPWFPQDSGWDWGRNAGRIGRCCSRLGDEPQLPLQRCRHDRRDDRLSRWCRDRGGGRSDAYQVSVLSCWVAGEPQAVRCAQDR